MVSSTDERLSKTLNYISNDISSSLRVRLDEALIGRNKVELAEAISLGGAGYWRHGSEGQHSAVRALILCQKVFLYPPWAKGAAGWDMVYVGDEGPDWAKTHFLKKTEEEVKAALRAYFMPTPGTRPGLVEAARNSADASTLYYAKLTRETSPFPGMQICFDAVRMWLFKAGFVSIPWLTKFGMQITAQTANQMLGDGEVVHENVLQNFPAGYIFNFHREGDKSVCHWGIGLGGRNAVGANTTAKAGSGSDEKRVAFISGSSVYGTFDLKSSYDVCVRKYARAKTTTSAGETHARVVIRKIDPTTVAGYF